MEPEGFYARYREALHAQADAYGGIRDALDAEAREAVEVEERRVLEHLRAVLDEEGRGRAEAFRAEMRGIEAGQPPTGRAAGRLEDLGVDALHVLARLDSTLRHSIVEACLMNLRGYAEALDERRDDPTFLEKLAQQVGLLPGVVQQVVDFFSRPRIGGVAVKDLLPVPYKLSLAALRGVLWLVDRFREPDPGRFDVAGRDLAARIDALTHALNEVRQAVDERRTALALAARRGVTALEPDAERAGVVLRFDDRTEGGARLFLDATRVANAVGELVRNALRHGLDETSGERLILVTVQDDDPPSTEVRVVVEDSGRGFSAAVLERLGHEAVSTGGGGDGLRLAMDAMHAHFGRLEVEAAPAGGARVSLVFPRHAPANA